jgi:hypothetical protein
VRYFPATGAIDFDDHWKALDARNIEQAFSNFCGKVGKI